MSTIFKIINFYFYRKSDKVKSESEEESEIKTDIIVGISTPKQTQKVKRKSSLKNDQNNKIVKHSLKKKKSSSQNWTVSDDV